ncbi:MAG: MerR family transcriptional regulator [Solirubrobacteraceae bacterium MAG38_C4-C5]|nr:MerR family transcriptional regulator [Candidatus Siliceabacter maunaloa]
MSHLQIGDLARLTGVAAATLRVWESRFGFPAPERTEAGYRRYCEDDVEAVRRVAALRERGIPVADAIASARDGGEVHASIYAAVTGSDPAARPQMLRKASLVAISRAIEHETMASGTRPVVVGAFQREGFYRAVEHRYRRMARVADSACVFADFAGVRRAPGSPVELPLRRGDVLGNEWAVIVDAPGFAACLLAWEHPAPPAAGDPNRRFESLWTVDPRATRRAARAAARLARRVDAAYADELDAVLEDRPLAFEEPAPTLTALANRVVGYLETA